MLLQRNQFQIIRGKVDLKVQGPNFLLFAFEKGIRTLKISSFGWCMQIVTKCLLSEG